MARSQQSRFRGSQFYITYVPRTLDGNYTVFGEVTADEHVDRIKQGDRMKSVVIVEA